MRWIVSKDYPLQDLLTLRSLAHNRTTLARASLFEKVSGLWLDDCATLTASSQGVMDDILTDLVSDVEAAVRARIAAGLADKDVIPKKLMAVFAADPDITVSGSVLSKCKSLSDETLLTLARTRGAVHRQAIAKRESISCLLSTALCERREIPVLKILASNPGAELSRMQFRDLVAMARDDKGLRESLLERSDLPIDFAFRMFWWVSAALRRQILERFAIEPIILDDILHEMLSDIAVARANLDAEQSAAATPSGSINNLIQALKSGEMRAFVQGLARAACVAPETAARIVNDHSGECLAIAAKAIGADRAQFVSMVTQLDFQRSGQARPLNFIEGIARAYDAVSQTNASAAVTLWNIQFRAAA